MFHRDVKVVSFDSLSSRASFVGKVVTDYQSIVAKLGPPHEEAPDPDKTIFTWNVDYRGEIFEVYDYDWQNPKPTKEEIITTGALVDWHIRTNLREQSEEVESFKTFLTMS